MSKEVDASGQDRQVEMWKVKKLIKSLQAARGYVALFARVVVECWIVTPLFFTFQQRNEYDFVDHPAQGSGVPN